MAKLGRLAPAHDMMFDGTILDFKIPALPVEVAARQLRVHEAIMAAGVFDPEIPSGFQEHTWRTALEVAYAVDQALDRVLGVRPCRQSECGHLQPPPAPSDEHGAILTRVCETCGLSLWWQVDRWREL